MFSVPPAATTVFPVPPIVPPLQFSAPLTVRSPAPLSVPPLKLKSRAIFEAPDTVSVPPVKLMLLFETRLATVVLPVRNVMTALSGRLINTSSAAPGTTPVLQLLATSQKPPAGFAH